MSLLEQGAVSLAKPGFIPCDVRMFPYHHVDVFTERPLEGNPLAVFTAPGDLSGTEMQQIAREMNLAETVFVLAPESPRAVARLRIFTPRRELTFAGSSDRGRRFDASCTALRPSR